MCFLPGGVSECLIHGPGVRGRTGVAEKVVVVRLDTTALRQKRNIWEITVHNMCMIDPRLITLRVFARCGTVGATAELTGYSPSAVSAQLRGLQRVLGMQLLTKDGRGVRLTATGRFLVTGSDTLIAEWESLRTAAMEAGDQMPSHFGLGGFSTAAAQLLAPLAATLRSTRPLLEVQVLEADPARCFDLLVAERIDLAVIVAMQSDTYVEDDPRFEQTVLLDDPLDVIVSSDHPLASRETVTLEELATEPWITEAAGSTYHSLFTAAFKAVGVTPRIAHEAVEWETQIAFVGAGLGVGLLPRLAPLHGAENVVRLRLTGQGKPARRIVAVVRRGSITSPLIQESLGILQLSANRILAGRPEDDL
jgi:DNA-binding transcriptional LysR family regulator